MWLNGLGPNYDYTELSLIQSTHLYSTDLLEHIKDERRCVIYPDELNLIADI